MKRIDYWYLLPAKGSVAAGWFNALEDVLCCQVAPEVFAQVIQAAERHLQDRLGDGAEQSAKTLLDAKLNDLIAKRLCEAEDLRDEAENLRGEADALEGSVERLQRVQRRLGAA